MLLIILMYIITGRGKDPLGKWFWNDKYIMNYQRIVILVLLYTIIIVPLFT